MALFEYLGELYPDQYRTWHSLAEAYSANHIHAQAIVAFEQTLSLLLQHETLTTQDKEEWEQEILEEIKKLKTAIDEEGSKNDGSAR